MICNKCGFEHDGNFCPQCGTPAMKAEEVIQKGKFCTNCGKPIKSGVCLNCGVRNNIAHNYCYYCGTALANKASVCVSCNESIRSNVLVRVLAIISLCLTPLWLLFVAIGTQNSLCALLVLLSASIMLFVALPVGQRLIRQISHKKRWLRFPLYLLCFVLALVLAISPIFISRNAPSTVEDTGSWKIEYYKDEFDTPTDDWYITNKKYIEGTFSNIATTDSRLYVKLYVNEDIFAIQLLEHGSHMVKNSFSKDELYEIMVKWEDGTKSKFYEYMPSGEDRIIFQSPDDYYITQKLRTNSEIAFYITESNRTTTNYSFTVKSDNFNEVYTDLTNEGDNTTTSSNNTVTSQKSSIEIVKESYNDALALAKNKNADQDYSYIQLHNEVKELMKQSSFDKEAYANIFGEVITEQNANAKCTDLLTYVVDEDDDSLSALMRKFKQVKSVEGEISETSVNISVRNVQDLLDELSIAPETLGRILAMLDIYDYSWLSSNEDDKFLQFTDTGFTFKWSAVGEKKLNLG